MSLAPVILFCYNRPKHTQLTLQQLKNNELATDSILYIFVDGPKENATKKELEDIQELKKNIRKEQWCKEVIIKESQHNQGLAKAVIAGVTEVVNKHGKVIVLEDDHLTDRYFLSFMNDALNTYESENSVACISGYMYPVKQKLPSSFFIKGADCWGWATWKRAWEILETDGKKLLQQLEANRLTNDFDFFGTYPYTQMLKDQIAGKNNSWAILWYASTYLKNKLCLYPAHSLIENIGNDGSGTNSGVNDLFRTKLLHQRVTLPAIKAKEDTEAKRIVSRFFKTTQTKPTTGFLTKILSKVLGKR